jgi:hypothetical protein
MKITQSNFPQEQTVSFKTIKPLLTPYRNILHWTANRQPLYKLTTNYIFFAS